MQRSRDLSCASPRSDGSGSRQKTAIVALPLGRYLYRHIQPDLFFGYERRQVDRMQHAFVAAPAKALLDLVHLQLGGDDRAFLESLRLQNLDRLDVGRVEQMTEQAGKPKLQRAARRIAEIATEEAEAYELL